MTIIKQRILQKLELIKVDLQCEINDGNPCKTCKAQIKHNINQLIILIK